MTDRLSTLLHAEATGLDVPPALIDAVLSGGRTIRRRRRTAVAVLGAAAAVVVIAVGAAVIGLDPADHSPEPAKLPDQTAYVQLGAWAQGDDLHVGNHTAVVPGLGQLFYTSAGVVARSNDEFVLVSPAGKVQPLDLDLLPGGVGLPWVATDPGTPNLAYVRKVRSDRGQVVVRDLSTGAEIEAGAPFTSQSPAGLVRWLSGDLVSYFGAGGDGKIVDWRTGEPSSRPQQGWWQAAGVSVNFSEATWTLTTFDGEPLLKVAADPVSSYGSLSPDGRYFLVGGTEPGMTVYDVATGDKWVLTGRAPAGYGWTPDGHLVGARTGGRGIEICDAAARSCEDTGTSTTGTLTLVVGTPGSTL